MCLQIIGFYKISLNLRVYIFYAEFIVYDPMFMEMSSELRVYCPVRNPVNDLRQKDRNTPANPSGPSVAKSRSSFPWLASMLPFSS